MSSQTTEEQAFRSYYYPKVVERYTRFLFMQYCNLRKKGFTTVNVDASIPKHKVRHAQFVKRIHLLSTTPDWKSVTKYGSQSLAGDLSAHVQNWNQGSTDRSTRQPLAQTPYKSVPPKSRGELKSGKDDMVLRPFAVSLLYG